jgi:hypothetical protein
MKQEEGLGVSAVFAPKRISTKRNACVFSISKCSEVGKLSNLNLLGKIALSQKSPQARLIFPDFFTFSF